MTKKGSSNSSKQQQQQQQIIINNNAKVDEPIIKINVNVHPNSKESSIVSFEDQILSLRISEPPIDGKANIGVIEFLSKELNIRKSNIEVGKGSKSRNKSVEIDISSENITKDELFERIKSKLNN
ncbi:hypothetical protein DDB_G0280783 [Dictyostelium discoideum AX4]|uniref:UPF0235 protein n=1 Tax=Dictyostelium discoideum TaxID=44689 RepID=U235_DICDI|nr:hypothetical protein DDB_G0280783 [Dictyostelium discoideum AX4]Q54UW1.1 RecName: Full=UPF0235 protein [Dictyostelium discoideum]EAL67049.1 hypothetical protein DDB_G0280783 [Dictyostelium discoideum AX4]|eukprot:XP_641026.1 hypothetical protein DDB_G0280783 [Dictyostelium discoideum AX4]